VGKHIQDMPCTWRLLWLAAEWPWTVLAWPLPTLLAQTCLEITPFPY